MKLTLILFILSIIAFTVACQSDQDIEFKRYYSAGQLIYQNRCQNCHGADGAGLGTLIPPLSDTVYLKKNRSNLTCIVYNGIFTPITIQHKPYFQKMPPTGFAPVEIAEVLTYITNSFGNKSGTYPTDFVNKNLLNCK